MNRGNKFTALALFTTCMLMSGSLSATETINKVYRVGALAFASPISVYQRWQPTLERVSVETGLTLELIPLTPNELEQAVAKRQLDFIIGNALTSLTYKKDYGVSNLLTMISVTPSTAEHAVGSALIAKRSLKLSDSSALKQLRVISSDPKAFGGFQILAGELAHDGINIYKDLKGLTFVGFPQRKLLDQLLADEADIAILPTCVLESAINSGQVPADVLHVLLKQSHPEFGCQASSRLYPSYAFSKLGHTDHQIATDIVKVMLNIVETDLAAVEGRYRFWSAPVKDNHVFELLKQLDQWPFVTNWQRLRQDASPWVIFIGFLLLLGYLHHLRVKRLVVKRTKALREEMAEHKSTQKQLFEQQKQFFKAQRILLTGEMASGIAHELNQPLAGVRYLTQGCIYRLDDDQGELKEALNRTIEQVDRAQGIVKRFRNFCHQPSVLMPCDLKLLIEQTLTLMEPDFNRMRLTPSLELIQVEINADPSLLQQVLVNLIRNALDAMESTHSPALTIRLYQTDSSAELHISDNGIGLDDNALSRLFFPFETTKATGLGLGMVVCKRIVEEHGGNIHAKKNLPTGLTLSVTLPIEER